jgi:hypothetical protein
VFSTLGVDFGAFAAFPALEDLTRLAATRGVRTAGGHPLRFVPAAPRPRRRAARQGANGASPVPYERGIYERGEVPTRAASWHDFFNALMWCALPRAKAALNERQCLAPLHATDLDRSRAQTRTREQDRLAMFDEGGALVVRPTAGPAAAPRALIVGHAVHELEITAPADVTVMTIEVAADSLAEADGQVAELVRRGELFATGVGLQGRRLAELRPLLRSWPVEAPW